MSEQRTREAPSVVPFYRLHRRTYSAAWDVLTPAEFEKRASERDAERGRIRLAQQSLPESRESRFFDVTYQISPELVGGKSRVTVRFQSAAGSEVPAVLGIRFIRSE